ncbi:hypothetical protein PAXRUDRAFT_827496 [Paxillus rubicundulus Ve08.2h10]|uniref:Uncharacterized protein n=1 Tax=Paxillus rubicundulus Ve08.2h10 TaxID=930991 RepID=A0A0D0E8I2_9AGAM|nr:hypothetical protein PAXRUDRAFT_827496 [Paxillus rubicundulus Ve08.2h10]
MPFSTPKEPIDKGLSSPVPSTPHRRCPCAPNTFAVLGFDPRWSGGNDEQATDHELGLRTQSNDPSIVQMPPV